MLNNRNRLNCMHTALFFFQLWQKDLSAWTVSDAHSYLRSPPPWRCFAAMDLLSKMDTVSATTPSQTTSSFQCPASMRARRHAQQNLWSTCCRDCRIWWICAMNAALTQIQLSEGKVRHWSLTHRQASWRRHCKGNRTQPRGRVRPRQMYKSKARVQQR